LLVTSFSDPIPKNRIVPCSCREAVVHAIRDTVEIRIEGLSATALSAVKAVSSSRRRRRCPRNPCSERNAFVLLSWAFRIAGAAGEIKARRNSRIAGIPQAIAIAVASIRRLGNRTVVASIRDSVPIPIRQAKCSGKAVLRVRNERARIASVRDEIEVGIGVVVQQFLSIHWEDTLP
jgi:hypothetical protein